MTLWHGVAVSEDGVVDALLGSVCVPEVNMGHELPWQGDNALPRLKALEVTAPADWINLSCVLHCIVEGSSVLHQGQGWPVRASEPMSLDTVLGLLVSDPFPRKHSPFGRTQDSVASMDNSHNCSKPVCSSVKWCRNKSSLEFVRSTCDEVCMVLNTMPCICKDTIPNNRHHFTAQRDMSRKSCRCLLCLSLGDTWAGLLDLFSVQSLKMVVP